MAIGEIIPGQPPRRLPLTLRAIILFGAESQQLGWMLFGGGLVFFWAFGMNTDWTFGYRFRGALDHVRGRIVSVGKTGASEQTGAEPPREIIAYSYTFRTGHGAYEGVSYSPGAEKSREGSEVEVEVVRDDSSVSRVRGMRDTVFEASPSVVLLILTPLLGIRLIAPGVFKGIRACRWLKNGEVVEGVLRSETLVRQGVLKKNIYRLVFDGVDSKGARREIVVSRSLMNKGRHEILVFGAAGPSRAVMLDDLPGPPRIDGRGRLVGPDAARSASLLVLPILTVLGHGFYVLFHFFL